MPTPDTGQAPDNRRTSHRPLEGLLVITLEQAVAAPLCTARLQQAGARVIKIERNTGDFARDYDIAASGESSYFTWTNQGKESLVLDIKNPVDLANLKSLLAQADVFVQNLAPGAVDRLGLDSESLRAANPRLVTCDISGYGNDDKVSHLKAYDLLVQAESGLVSISGGPGEPGRIGISLCDIGAGVTAHAAILEALIGRGTTGAGDSVKVSLFDVAAEWMTVPFVHARYGQGAPGRQGLLHPSIAPYGAYRTADNVDTLLSIQNEREWFRFCDKVLLDPGFAEHPLFDSNDNRVVNRPALDEAILAKIGELSADQFRQRLAAGSIAYGALNGVEDLLTHAALRTRQATTSAGQVLELPAHPVIRSDHSDGQSDGKPGEQARTLRSPRLGEHTDAIKREFNLD